MASDRVDISVDSSNLRSGVGEKMMRGEERKSELFLNCCSIDGNVVIFLSKFGYFAPLKKFEGSNGPIFDYPPIV